MNYNTLKKNSLFQFSALLLILFSLVVFFATEASYNVIENTSIWVRNYFGYFYLYLGLGSVLLLLGIVLSPLGKHKLGKPDSKPEHSLWAWTAMLYSAGNGCWYFTTGGTRTCFYAATPLHMNRTYSPKF